MYSALLECLSDATMAPGAETLEEIGSLSACSRSDFAALALNQHCIGTNKSNILMAS